MHVFKRSTNSLQLHLMLFTDALFSFCFSADLHSIRQMLHIQLWPGWTATPHYHERGYGQRPGTNAGHSTGRVPASVGRDR